jgi:hypothetical protein
VNIWVRDDLLPKRQCVGFPSLRLRELSRQRVWPRFIVKGVHLPPDHQFGDVHQFPEGVVGEVDVVGNARV